MKYDIDHPVRFMRRWFLSWGIIIGVVGGIIYMVAALKEGK
jgi:hypothetical protein